MPLKKNTLVRKANELVNARYAFSIRENRVFLKLLTLISPKDEDFRRYAFTTADFVKEFGVTNKDVYAELEKVTNGLLKKIIQIPFVENDKEMIFKTALVSSFLYCRDGTGAIEAQFHPQLKPFLLQLKTKYLSYDLRNVVGLSTSSSLRFYELLKQFEKIGSREWSVTALKELLGVADKYADRYHNFKVRVILQAQKELKAHTDITFDYQEIKRCKSVESVRFHIFKTSRQTEATNLKLAPEAVELLWKYGIQPDESLSQTLASQPFETLQAVCQKAEQIFAQKRRTGNPIANESGYLLKLLNNPASFQSAERKALKSRSQQTKQAEQQKLDDLKQRFNRELAAKTDTLRAKHLTAELKTEVLTELQNSVLYPKICADEKRGKENLFLKIQIDRRLQREFLKPEERDFEKREKINHFNPLRQKDSLNLH